MVSASSLAKLIDTNRAEGFQHVGGVILSKVSNPMHPISSGSGANSIEAILHWQVLTLCISVQRYFLNFHCGCEVFLVDFGMIFFHNAEEKVVYAAPDEPDVSERKDGWWVISATIHSTRADNYTIPGTHQWRFPVRSSAKESYDCSRDSREKAINYFKFAYYPNCPTITESEYLRLQVQYQREANQNRPAR